MGGVTSYSYDQANNLVSLNDPVGNITYFGYDGQNQLVLETNALSKSKTYVYDIGGNLTRTIDRNGKTIQYVRDGLDRVTEEKWQENASPAPSLTVSTTQEGGAINEVQRVGYQTSAYTVSGTFTYHNRTMPTTSALSATATAAQVQSALEALSGIGTGNVTVELLAKPPGTNDRTFKITFIGSKAATNMPQTTTNVGGLSTYPAGTPTAVGVTDATGGTFTETQSIVLANSSGGTWRLAYNGEVTAPLSPSATSSQVDAALEALQGIDLVTVTGSSGSFTVTFAGTHTNQNAFQIFGTLLQPLAAPPAERSLRRTTQPAKSPRSAIQPQQSPTLGTTLAERQPSHKTIAGLTPTVVFNQAFDAASNRTELKATIGGVNDFKNTYQYDALQRLTDNVQQGQSGGNAVTAKHLTFTYNVLSQRTNIARYQSTGTTNAVATTDYTYDTGNRLASITHKQGGTTLAGYTYGFDNASRLTSVNSTIEGLSTYSYDATSQVTAADHNSQTDETYSYDLNGNRNSSGYTTTTNNRTTAGGGFTYVYDDEGNRTSRTETSTGKVQDTLGIIAID